MLTLPSQDRCAWNPDKVMIRLVNNKEVRSAIIVAIWMADWTKGARGLEFMPQKAVTDEVWSTMQEQSANDTASWH